MRPENQAILQREMEHLQRETERTPFGVVGFSVILHAGLISRVTRTIETSERASPDLPVRRFAAGGPA